MRKTGLTSLELRQAVFEMMQGLIDADLGGHIVKKRVAISGRGKRGGARTIIATTLSDRWFFLYGFGKNERENIGRDELKMLQEVAKNFLSFNECQLAIAIAAGEIQEVCNDSDQT